MKKKSDEENFDEAVAQVFKAYQRTTVASLLFGVPFRLPNYHFRFLITSRNCFQIHPVSTLTPPLSLAA